MDYSSNVKNTARNYTEIVEFSQRFEFQERLILNDFILERS